MIIALRLALRDFAHDLRVNLSLSLAVAAIIAPLLILFSLKFGIVAAMERDLLGNPGSRELVLGANYRLSEDFFAMLRGDPRVAFVVPKTRSLSTTATMRHGGALREGVEMVPTDPGDPLLLAFGAPVPRDSLEVVLSASLGARLGARPGERAQLVVTRTKEGRRQAATLELLVVGTLPPVAVGRDQAFVPLPTLLAIEDYKDGFEPQLLSDGSRPNTARDHFAKARIYARGLDDVAPLAQLLEGRGMVVHDERQRIGEMKAIATVLSRVFWVIAAVVALGGIMALGGLLLRTLEARMRSFMALGIMGITTMGMQAMVALEALALALLSYLMALLLTLLAM
nr:hypothetical protein [Succinivibrionaceae bacterium]